jgi:hypothetical protein
MRQILFFALKNDLIPVFEAVERSRPLKYVLMGWFPEAYSETFAHGIEIPNLGKASASSAINCESFLVTERSEPIKAEPVYPPTGKRFSIDQLLNPNTVTFTPAGIWSDEIILNGRVATASDSKLSQELMRTFHSAIKKHFRKVRAFWVGAQAFALFEVGKRLTISSQSPPDFDLKPAPTEE